MFQNLKTLLIGGMDAEKPPERVREAIEHQQIQSERLIGCAQLLLVTVFGVLWAVSPPPQNETVFQPVPWALAIYFGFTVVRVLWSLKGAIAPWFLTLSIIVDIALLMVLIWSFHIQYEQPPSFYLKAPTLMYVFIFISLRALRFEPRYIVFAGVTAGVVLLLPTSVAPAAASLGARVVGCFPRC